MKKDTGKGLTFEGKIRRLEEIIAALEDGEKPLDDVVGMFEEGIRLSSECMDHLNKTELRLKKLTKDASGMFQTVPENHGQ